MTHRLGRWIAVALLAAGTLQQAQAVLLVTEEEAAQSRAASTQLVARSPLPANAPVIKLLAPDTASAITSPTRIELRFEPAPQASIRPETFRVFYGALKLDITSRLMANSKVSAQGLDVSEAHLPKGSHRLVLEVQDTAGRIGARLVSFVVE
jgi:hypothetical protein